jgi:hypothetical protein
MVHYPPCRFLWQLPCVQLSPLSKTTVSRYATQEHSRLANHTHNHMHGMHLRHALGYRCASTPSSLISRVQSSNRSLPTRRPRC